MTNHFLFRVPMRYWKSIELWNRFSIPWKSIEFGQNVHKVLKKHGNSKFSQLFIHILFFAAITIFACVLHCVPQIKFWKMKIVMVLKFFI